MSRGSFHEENSAECLEKTLTRVPEDEKKILNPFLWPPIAENYYKTYDVDKKSLTGPYRPAQTEVSLSKHILNSALSSQTYYSETAKNLGDRPIENEENSDEDYPQQQPFLYGSCSNNQSNSLYDVSMNNRKNMFDKSGASRVSDLERKKLEAELKAAQEIARIQQTVIEKRLALELASINNGKEGKDGRDSREPMPHPTHNSPKTQPDFAFMEEVTRRNGAIDNNYVSEMEPQKVRPMMPKPVPSMSSRLVNSERLRNGFGNELLYKKSHSPENYESGNSSPNGNLDLQGPEIKYYKHSNSRMHRPAVQMPVQIQMSSHRDSIYERPGWPGPQPRNHFSWRAFIGKMKRGFRNKPRDEWD